MSQCLHQNHESNNSSATPTWHLPSLAILESPLNSIHLEHLNKGSTTNMETHGFHINITMFMPNAPAFVMYKARGKR